MATVKFLKHICDRCGASLEVDSEQDFNTSEFPYPKEWQLVKLGQTGAHLDLCEACNKDLYAFLVEKDASNMQEAVFKDRRVI